MDGLDFFLTFSIHFSYTGMEESKSILRFIISYQDGHKNSYEKQSSDMTMEKQVRCTTITISKTVCLLGCLNSLLV